MMRSAYQKRGLCATWSLSSDRTNAAYTGQFDPTIGGNINGIVWIHNELQGIATMDVTAVSANGGHI
jgi:hypothetical protein